MDASLNRPKCVCMCECERIISALEEHHFADHKKPYIKRTLTRIFSDCAISSTIKTVAIVAHTIQIYYTHGPYRSIQ